MGLSSTLSNALSGMNASQRGLEVISRNVANAGTPGYHRQSVGLKETTFGQSAQVRMSSIQRAFDQALERQHVVSVSQSSYHGVRAAFLDRLQVAIGKPGDVNALDKLYSTFENALQALAAAPDDMAARAGVLRDAQALASQLNGLSGSVQEMRRETETHIFNAVANLNRNLTSLADVNVRILDLSQDESARLAMLDERDRLVASISEEIDIRVNYRSDGTVSLMTGSGIGLLDNQPSSFAFSPSAQLSSTGATGTLELITPGGRRITMDSLVSGGAIAGLLEMRDNTLVNAQDQLDQIAAGLALAMSTRPPTTGISAAGGVTTVDASEMMRGNGFVLNYTEGGVAKAVRIVNAAGAPNTDPTNINGAGQRVITADLSDPAAVASALQTALGGAFTVADNGSGGFAIAPAGTTTLQSATSFITANATQGHGDALPLFLDGTAAFSGALEGGGQQAGFASRIAINPSLITNPNLVVQSTAGTSLGSADRPGYLLENLRGMSFVSDKVTSLQDGGFRLTGRVGDLISQTMNYQGDTVARGLAQSATANATLGAVTTRMTSSYGVNIDEEMARLMELQNAYSASARVVSTVQELIDALLAM